ncbi:cytochrome bd oxidase small subunit CydS [Edaphobacillus lindanitolerans]|uniref:Uncharacterized protein n=1 Tax=Edaphobacillus lindanitolerans TaxID=550447 RepID=A0A1U7PTP1_9BACI|nr:hypothetical protein [Edaphobacillus lindanitolerans]SIT92959.1 hypothetical protein SAMN05428946_2902 [Edaphobacillus lindanitolerans]
MNEFLIFYAPFIVLIGVIIAAFVISPFDDAVTKGPKERKKK